MAKSAVETFIYTVRDRFARKMFPVIKTYCRGCVLDVGGYDFFRTAIKKGVQFDSWYSLEHAPTRLFPATEPNVTLVCSDGCRMGFADNSFDTVLNVQVLEHVLEPIEMVRETARVLKPGGHAIFLIPWTTPLHLVPYHYANYTIFWIREIMPRAGLQIVALEPLGGRWTTMASHHFYFIYHTIIRRLQSPTGSKRSILFYLLYPFMVLYALINFPICLFLSLGDLDEEANNHLVVVKKPGLLHQPTSE